jgi:gliding motility-associated-like protein
MMIFFQKCLTLSPLEMDRNMKKHLLTLFLLSCSLSLFSQFRTNGTAIAQGANCFRLTRNLTAQSGSVWQLSTVDISKPFDLYLEVNLGCSNGGADGMAFVLQPISSSVGSSGGGLGYQGITPSLAIEMDTYQNGGFGDPVFDHIAIMSNGVNNHNSTNNLAGPVAALSGNGNLEDCNWHDLRITWDTSTYTLRVYLDCSLRLTYTGNIVQNIFNNNPYVFWGFTAATGALTNEHKFCYNYLSFTQSLKDTTICIRDTVDLNVGTGFTYAWTPNVGLSDSSVANPRAYPDTTTTYYVTVTDPCMNTRRDSITITVETPADLLFYLGPDTTLCGQDSIPYDFTRTGVQYLWHNGSTMPTFTVNSPGKYWLELRNACGFIPDTINVLYESIPTVDLGPDTLVCDMPSLLLDATFVSQTVPGTQYMWKDGSLGPTNLVFIDDTVHVQVSNFCGTAIDTIAIRFLDSPQPFSLGPDTVICNDNPLQLNIYQANMSHSWNTGSTDSVIWVDSTALYVGSVQNECGTEMDDIQVTAVTFPSGTLPPDTTLCPGQVLLLSLAAPPTSNITWNNGVTGPNNAISFPGGMIICYETNACGTNSDTIIVSFDSLPAPDAGPDSTLCEGEMLTLDISAPNATSYQWIGGPATAQYSVSSPAIYIGEATNLCGTVRDTVVISRLDDPVLDLGPDLLLCDRDSAIFDYSGQAWLFQWQDDYDLPGRAIQDSGLYWLEVSNRCGADRDSINIAEERSPLLSLPVEDTVVCTGDVLELDASRPNIDSYLWSDGSTNSSFATVEEGRYWLQVANVCGTARDSFMLWLDTLPAPDLGPDTALCEGEALNFNVYQVRASYLWEDGSAFATRIANREGQYWVEVNNSCGTVRDEMKLIFDQKPTQIDLGFNQVLCLGDSFQLDATVASTPTAPVQYNWIDGSTDSIRWITRSGLYRVEVSNRCGRVYDLMEATFEAPLNPDLGADTLRCQNEQILLDATIEGVNSYRWQDGSSEARFLLGAAGLYWVTVENSCGTATDSIRVTDTDCNCTVFVPSAFTPNGDQHNDEFCISYECEFLAFEMKVFNRWGQLIWQNEDPSACWAGDFKGAVAPEGVYVYVINYQSRENKREAQKTLSGTITLVR